MMPTYVCPQCGKSLGLSDGEYVCRECGVAMQVKSLSSTVVDVSLEAISPRGDSVNPFERVRRACVLLIKDDEKDIGKIMSTIHRPYPHHYLIGMILYAISFPIEDSVMKLRFFPSDLREAIKAEKA